MQVGENALKLHLGCGKRFIPGWVHIDVVDYPHIDHVAQIDNLSFIADGSCDLIYASHVLEHFKRRDVGRVLKEWFRVLKPGGVLRLAVPNFAAVSEVYQKTNALEPLLGLLFGRQDYLYNIHYHIWDETTLRVALRTAGFGEVRHWDWRETEHAHIDDFSQAYLPHMDKNGTLMSLNMEAVK